MLSDNRKMKLVKESSRRLEVLVVSEEITVLDAHIFTNSEYRAIWNREDVKTSENKCKNFNRIRANRLKLLGYGWVQEELTWKQISEMEI